MGMALGLAHQLLEADLAVQHENTKPHQDQDKGPATSGKNPQQCTKENVRNPLVPTSVTKKGLKEPTDLKLAAAKQSVGKEGATLKMDTKGVAQYGSEHGNVNQL
jgi:hypothetical protein